MSGSVAGILYLYDRPSEPIFLAKDGQKTVFNVPSSYVVDHYKPIVELAPRAADYDGQIIDVKETDVPEAAIACKVKRDENFSIFLPRHQEAAAHLIEILYRSEKHDDFLSACVYYRDRVNPQLFIYCLSVAILHRPDTQNLPIPSLFQVFPEKFITGSVFSRAKEEAYVVPDGNRRSICVPPPTASDLEPENRLAYFREDVGINLHHWHWHLVYPFSGPPEIVRKDRRGELFFYMHSQFVARYNIERFCNKLGRVKRWNRWSEPIAEAYFSKLNSPLINCACPGRAENSVLKDIDRPLDSQQFDIQDMEIWRDRIFKIIAKGSYRDSEGKTVDLTEKDGIDVLGNIIEATSLSPNPRYYGDLHNSMHIALACVHDPDHRYLESLGPLGETITAMRDPMFYRLHAWVEYVFQRYKQTLPPYTVEQLNNPGINVTGVMIRTKDKYISDDQLANELFTFWQQCDVDLSRGLAFVPRGAIPARLTHMQYAQYFYKIQVLNTTGSNKLGTCRIFMAPKYNEMGTSMKFAEQKSLMIELDKFTVNLKPGRNVIERTSDKSSITIPYERTFGNWGFEKTGKESDSEKEILNFCGCGWPQHMLVPRGIEIGYDVEVFVMISNYDDDKIEQDINGRCTEGVSFCGIRNKKYPDARAMGYPFDRPPRDKSIVLSEFLTPNMMTIDVKIFHKDEVLIKPPEDIICLEI